MGEIDALFPFGSYRPKQQATLEKAKEYLWEKDYTNVIIDAPVGIGKSPINVALGRYAEDAFYTTPQRALRKQLQDDDVLGEHIKALKSRAEYVCGYSGQNCKECIVNNDYDRSCGEYNDCTYWNNKMATMSEDIAALTFAFLIYDSDLGTGDHTFDNRELLIIDECHNLEEQVASLFMGFDVGKRTLPNEVVGEYIEELDEDVDEYEEVADVIETVFERAKNFRSKYGGIEEMSGLVEMCRDFIENYRRMEEDLERDNPWVVNITEVEWSGDTVKNLQVKPVDVAGFLMRKVWPRGEKKVLSTATMPFRANPERWCARLGINYDDTAIIHVGMHFPISNRPIYTSHMVGSMSSGGDRDNWIQIMEKLNELAAIHKGTKGLIHTSSYERAKRIFDWSRKGQWKNLRGNILHHRGEDDGDIIDIWQNTDKDILASPSLTDGVDLHGDRCKWQVLLKVPYPPRGDSRVKYILDKRPGSGWNWYYNVAANSIVQSYGRAIRSRTDRASYYILDEDFLDVQRQVTFPPWFEEAIRENGSSDMRSALEW